MPSANEVFAIVYPSRISKREIMAMLPMIFGGLGEATLTAEIIQGSEVDKAVVSIAYKVLQTEYPVKSYSLRTTPLETIVYHRLLPSG